MPLTVRFPLLDANLEKISIFARCKPLIIHNMEPFDRSQLCPEYCDTYAQNFLTKKNKEVVYKCYGHDELYNSRPTFISCTEKEKSLLQELQSKEPDQDLSFLLEANGYDDLANQLSGDNFWCYNIDWTPIHMYQFSLIRFSKYSYLKRRERELTFIHLENDEYATILSRRLMAQGYSFTSLQSEFPELAGKIRELYTSLPVICKKQQNP